MIRWEYYFMGDNMEFIKKTECVFDKNQMRQLFNVLRANVVRSRASITALFLTLHNQTSIENDKFLQVEKEITSFLCKRVRETDLLFKLSEQFIWCIILSRSGEEEAKGFFKRIENAVAKKDTPVFIEHEMTFSVSVAQINNQNVVFDQLIEMGKEALKLSVKQGPWNINIIETYKDKDIETLKISILEENDIVRKVLKETLEGLPVNHFQLEIKLFQDGYEFLTSDWYLDSYTHVLVMNDILPRKNGLEVLHAIRRLPNNKRFIVYMMTKRKSEEDMIFAYESGVDEYLVRPLNLKLFKAQLIRTFERLWS
jgi:PleD family two-component response regulator